MLTAAIAGSETIMAGPIALDTWGQFSFEDVGTPAAGCQPADPSGGFCSASSGTPTVFLDAPAWTFIAPGFGVFLIVTDAFDSGDRFEVFDFGVSLGQTSAPTPGVNCGDDPVPCLANPNISSRTFFLAAGNHSITLIPTLSPAQLGSGFLLVSQVPEPTTTALLGLGLVSLALLRRRTG